MSIDLDNNLADLILTLAQTIEDLEPYAQPFTLEQGTEPKQSDWETAWLAAGNTLPIPEDQELYWQTGELIRGQFGLTNDRFYCIFPSTTVSLGGVNHFAYTKFLGWIDDQHFFISGTKLDDNGLRSGLYKVYLDGDLEWTTFTGFTANTLLGYDEEQRKLWYIEGTDLKRIDIDTEVITVISGGITVAPTQIAFDGAGDAFCTINIGAGLDIYRWNNGAATFTSFKASITVNGVGEDPGQVITASLNYVVVLTSASNYWVQVARAGGAETRIKSNPAGASAANIPAPDATIWVQTLGQRSVDILSIVFTELTGTPGLAEWRRTILWNMATATYTDAETLPSLLDPFIKNCINIAPSPEVLNHRRDINYFALTSAYRKRVGSVWEYHNISGIRSNTDNTRQLIETDDGQVFILSNEASGKIWRLSSWDAGESDSILITDIPAAGLFASIVLFNFNDVPDDYDIVEVTLNLATSDGGAVAIGTNNTLSDDGNLIFSGGGLSVYADNNTYGSSVNSRYTNNSTQGQIFSVTFIRGFEGLPHNFILGAYSDNTGIVNETVSLTEFFRRELLSSNPEFGEITLSFGLGLLPLIGGRIIARAFRTKGRRQGGAYYDSTMA